MPKLAINGGAPAVPANIGFQPWPRTTRQDEQYVLASLRQDNHAWGPNCVALQDEFARWNGNRFCAATNSGTAALHMGIAACGIQAGDEVITTTLSWTSTATSILHHNAIPVFVDVDEQTSLIDPAKIEAAITPRTRGILPVHYWGLPCDMSAILRIAQKHNLSVIEDCCQAHGSSCDGRKVGTFGHCSAFSLNQNKNLSAGEGGLFVSDDKAIFEAGRAVMTFGEMRPPEADRDFHAYALGWMYRTSDLAAALARSALARLDQTNAHARENWEMLYDGLAELPGLIRPFEPQGRKGNGYAFVPRVDARAAGWDGPVLELRDAIVAALKAEGVPVAAPRWMLPAHTVFQAKNGYGHGCPWTCGMARREVSYSLDQYPVTLRVHESSVQLGHDAHRPPNGPRQVQAVIRAVRKVFENLGELPIFGGRPALPSRPRQNVVVTTNREIQSRLSKRRGSRAGVNNKRSLEGSVP